jgi:uncharacterized protein YggE
MKSAIALFLAMGVFSCGLSTETGTISVTGSGEVLVTPDVAHLQLSISETAPTTRQAQNETNAKLAEVLKSLQNLEVAERDIQTSAISFSQDTEYDSSTRRSTVVGQIVSQTLNVQFKELTERPELLPSVLDVLGGINGIRINSLSFSLEDPQAHYVVARKLAFEKAQQKAEELAEYANLRLGAAVQISEQSVSYAANQFLQRNFALSEAESSSGSQVPGGEIPIKYDVSVVWETHR